MSQNKQATSLGTREATTGQYGQATTYCGTPNHADVPTALLASIFGICTYALASYAEHWVPTYCQLGLTKTL